MEKMVSRYYKKKVISTLVGYFLIGTIYTLFGGEDDGLRFIAAVIGSILLWILGDLYEFKNNPGLKEKIKILSDDERNHAVQGRAAIFTLTITHITLFVIVFIGIVLKNAIISYGAAILTLFSMAVNKVSLYHWNRKM